MGPAILVKILTWKMKKWILISSISLASSLPDSQSRSFWWRSITFFCFLATEFAKDFFLPSSAWCSTGSVWLCAKLSLHHKCFSFLLGLLLIFKLKSHEIDEKSVFEKSLCKLCFVIMPSLFFPLSFVQKRETECEKIRSFRIFIFSLFFCF